MNRREFLKAGVAAGAEIGMVAAASTLAGSIMKSDRADTIRDTAAEASFRETPDDTGARIQKLIDAVKGDVVKKTREVPLPHVEGEHRDPAFRFERGQIWNAYQYLRRWIQDDKVLGRDPEKWQDILKKLRDEAHKLERQLDILNAQVAKPVETVEIDSIESGKHKVPVYKIDLRDPESKEPDNRVPYFYCGTYLSNVEHNAELLMALALDGHVIYTVPNPERQHVESPADWKNRLEDENSFGPHAAYYSEVMKKLFGGKEGDKEVDLMGYSMGASVALELASNPGDLHLRDVIAMEPVGFEQKSVGKMMWDFGIRQGALTTLVNEEATDKSFVWPWKERVGVKKGADGPVNKIVSGKHFDAQKVAGSKLSGKLKVVLAENSPVSSPKLAQSALVDAKAANDTLPLNVYMMKGGHHGSPSIQTLGLMESMKQEPIGLVTELDTDKLDNSAVLLLLRRIKEKEGLK